MLRVFFLAGRSLACCQSDKQWTYFAAWKGESLNPLSYQWPLALMCQDRTET